VSKTISILSAFTLDHLLTMEKHADKGPLSESRSRGHARVKTLRHMK